MITRNHVIVENNGVKIMVASFVIGFTLVAIAIIGSYLIPIELYSLRIFVIGFGGILGFFFFGFFGWLMEEDESKKHDKGDK